LSRSVSTIIYPSLVLSSIAIHLFCEECHRHFSSSWLWSQIYENLITFLSLLLLNSSVYDLSMLSLHLSHHTPTTFTSLVCLFPAVFDGWFASLPLRVFRPNLGTRFFLGGEAVTVHVFVMLDLYFDSVKCMLVSVKLLCVCVKFLKILSKKGIFIITEKSRVVFVKCNWTEGNFKIREGWFCKYIFLNLLPVKIIYLSNSCI
jgi:hypothetical protein